MDIDEDLLRSYLRKMVGSYIDRHEARPDAVTGYHDGIVAAGQWAREHGDEQTLRLGLEYVLAHPEVNAGRFTELHNLDDEEARAVMVFARTTLWPDAGPIPPGGPEGVRLTRVPPPPAPPFRVRAELLRGFVSELTQARAAAADDEGFATAARTIYERIRRAGQQSELRIGLDHLLMNPEAAASFEAAAGLLEAARAVIWPDVARPARGGRGVVLV